MNLADTRCGKEPRHGETAQCDDDFGVDRFDLPCQIIRAGRNLFRKGITILRWPVLDNIRDEDRLTIQSDTGEQFIQERSGRSHKWAPLAVLMVARSLTDKHYLRMWAAFSGHPVGRVAVQWASLARNNFLCHRLEKLLCSHDPSLLL